MSQQQHEKLEILTRLIKEVKPSLAHAAISPLDSLTDTLGLDSLDVLQLVRKIRRATGQDFDLDAWSAEQASHKDSVQSVLDTMNLPVHG
jgi:acyl carrier protein